MYYLATLLSRGNSFVTHDIVISELIIAEVRGIPIGIAIHGLD